MSKIRVRKTKKSNQKKIKEGDIVVDKSTPMSTTTTQQHTRGHEKSYYDKTTDVLRFEIAEFRFQIFCSQVFLPFFS